MLVSAHDGGVDHLHAVLALAALVEGRQQDIPHARQRPAPELAVEHAPLAEITMQVASGRARACDPEPPVQHQDTILGSTAPPRSCLNHEWREEGPLLVR